MQVGIDGAHAEHPLSDGGGPGGQRRRHAGALLPRLEAKTDRSWRIVERSVADWWQLMEQQAMRDADPVDPQRVFTELSQRLPHGASCSIRFGRQLVCPRSAPAGGA